MWLIRHKFHGAFCELKTRTSGKITPSFSWRRYNTDARLFLSAVEAQAFIKLHNMKHCKPVEKKL